MKTTKKLLLLTAVLLWLSPQVYSQISSDKTEKIKTLLEVTGSAKLGAQISTQLINSLKNSNSKVPEGFWTAFEQEINTENLVKRIIPIYDKYYTEADIDGLIAFYQSELGKKLTSTLPVVMQESLQAGQDWGREIAEKALKKLKDQESGN